MAHPLRLAPFGPLTPTLVTSPHSQVRQEADYIQDRLIAAKALHRKLNLEIRKSERKLKTLQTATTTADGGDGDELSSDMMDKLKKVIRKRRARLNQCTGNERVFEARLMGIWEEMRRLEHRQLQWRYRGPALVCEPGLDLALDMNLDSGYPGPAADGSAFFSPKWQEMSHLTVPPALTPAIQMGHDGIQTQSLQIEHDLTGPPAGAFYPGIYLPRTPVLHPLRVPSCLPTNPNLFTVQHQQQRQWPEIFNVDAMNMSLGTSPTNESISPYDLTFSPIVGLGGMHPAPVQEENRLPPQIQIQTQQHVDGIVEAVHGLRIPQSQSGGQPSPNLQQVSAEAADKEADLARKLALLGRPSAGLRLQGDLERRRSLAWDMY